MTPAFQLISRASRPVAALVGDQVIIGGEVTASDLPLVKAMCAYASEVLDGTAPGPYSDELAELYATLALARSST
jgi:hypothetical protein